jgi:hypothetical protein
VVLISFYQTQRIAQERRLLRAWNLWQKELEGSLLKLITSSIKLYCCGAIQCQHHIPATYHQNGCPDFWEIVVDKLAQLLQGQSWGPGECTK